MATARATLPQPLHRELHITVGDWRLDFISGGRFVIDGGIMFGVVPRRLWEMLVMPDEQNRIPCTCNCLLARNGRRTILIDTGYGTKHAPLDRKFYNLEAEDRLAIELARVGVAPDEIDTVVLSHLHWDHAGGTTRRDGQRRLMPAFPRARHVVGRLEWQDAHSGADELAGSYPLEHIDPLTQAAQLDLVDDGHNIAPGIHLHLTGGHTRGHLAVTIESRDVQVMYLADLCPSASHLRRLWSLAYDVYPLETRREKPRWLGRAADGRWIVVWSHDPRYAASRITRDPRGEFAIAESWTAP
ncbi:MAG: MBL fold metallo-hydrolase [Pirellulales bacterium]|nr:MBL fold metallo-hydrolase [Pirellulales bacterium]